MKLLLVDDEFIALSALEDAITDELKNVGISKHVSGKDALVDAESNSYDVAFLDIELRDMTGIELAKRLKALQPNMNIVFVTGHDSYALDAFGVYASDYILKPITGEKVRKTLLNLRHNADVCRGKGLWVQCFGTFEVFYNSTPLHFERQKAKEMLAYLVDRRGARVTMAEMASILWEDGIFDKSRNNQLLVFIYVLTKKFEEIGHKDLIIRSRNAISINNHLLACDYYEYLNHNPNYVNKVYEEYMSQYSWAECTISTSLR
ncbi:MAG: response regulator [Erysipelotrichaceae bacterium]